MSKISLERTKRPLIFLSVGILNTLLDFICYSLLSLFVFTTNDTIVMLGIVSGTFALLIAYTSHRLITWRDHRASFNTIVRFFIVTGFGLWVIRPLLLSLFITFSAIYTPIHSFLQSVSPISITYEFTASSFAFAGMVVIVMIYNYVMYSKFVFNKPIHTDKETR